MRMSLKRMMKRKRGKVSVDKCCIVLKHKLTVKLMLRQHIMNISNKYFWSRFCIEKKLNISCIQLCTKSFFCLNRSPS